MPLKFTELVKQEFWGIPLRKFSIKDFIAEHIKADCREPDPLGLNGGRWFKTNMDYIRIRFMLYDKQFGNAFVTILFSSVEYNVDTKYESIMTKVTVERILDVGFANRSYTESYELGYDDDFANRLITVVEQTRNKLWTLE